jgi:pilus assembly protein CpaF
MTAVSGGDQPDNDGRSPTGSVLERPAASADAARAVLRPLDQIFPLGADNSRAPQLQEAWQAFGRERTEAVRAALAPERSPPEIAYAVGEIVHTFFRARGLTLTSYELRRLVAELLDLHGRARPPSPARPAKPATRVPEKAPEEKKPDDPEGAVVSFASEPAAEPWAGDDEREQVPSVPDSVFEPPPSLLVSLLGREDAAFDRLLANVLELARPRLGSRHDRALARPLIAEAIDRIAGDESEPLSAELRERLRLVALTELCGLGLIDRLWADPTVHAIFVNGPGTVFVERNGLLEATTEAFRDEAHLAELLAHLAPRPQSGVAQFRLRDGGTGTAVFPPAAPKGPVVALRRAEPGSATFERLIVADVLDRKMADLVRICAHCRLNILVAGPPGSGKTALLAALARDMGEARVVTVARHRVFRWPMPSKVELVATSGTGLPALVAAGAALQPDLLVVDSVQLEDVPALMERLARGVRGTVAAVEPESLAAGLTQSVDLVLRLGRGRDGQHRVVAIHDAKGTTLFVHEGGRFQFRSSAPAFVGTVRGLGLGEALASVLR